MRRYGLRDNQWDRIMNLLPGRPGTVGVTASDNRLFVEAVLYRYRTGIPWRDPPERFGDRKNVHRRHSRWAETGVWERVFQHLAADADNEYAMIDSTIVSGALRPLGHLTIQADCCVAQCQGINSSMRFCGQPFTSRVSKSVK